MNGYLQKEGNGVRVKVKRGRAGKVNVGKVKLTYFYRLKIYQGE